MFADIVREKYPAFIDYYEGVSDTTLNKMESFYDAGNKNKAALRAMLGIPEGTTKLRIKNSTANPTSTFPATIQLLKEIVRESKHKFAEQALEALRNDSAIVKNETSSGGRLSRLLVQIISGPENWRTLASRWQILRNELPALPEAIYQARKAGEVLIQNLYARITSTRKDVVISTDIWDIMNASNSTGFRSCFAIGGAYATSVLSMALDPCVALCYVSNTDARTSAGRFWVYFNMENRAEAILCNPYGAIGQFELDTAGAAITTKLTEVNTASAAFPWLVVNRYRIGAPFTMRVSLHKMASTSTARVYVDSCAAALLYNPAGGGTRLGFVPSFEAAKCPCCGKQHTSAGAYLLCHKCASTAAQDSAEEKAGKQRKPRCLLCNAHIPPEEIHVASGMTICKSCYSTIMESDKCSICGATPVVAVLGGKALCGKHLLEATSRPTPGSAKRIAKLRESLYEEVFQRGDIVANSGPFDGFLKPAEASKFAGILSGSIVTE